MRTVLRLWTLTAATAFFATQVSALFIQADTYPVTDLGVGTNRYAYSGDDPINASDPSGHVEGNYPTDDHPRAGNADGTVDVRYQSESGPKESEYYYSWNDSYSDGYGKTSGEVTIGYAESSGASLNYRNINVSGGDGFGYISQRDSYTVSEYERVLALNKDVDGYYRSRLAARDPIAGIGLLSLHPPGTVSDYLFGGASINYRLDAYSRSYLGHPINLEGMRVDLMNSEISAIDSDKSGVIGLLSPGQIYDYHVSVFGGYGLPPATFGGAPMTGARSESYVTSGIWCRGCDVH